MFRSISTLVGLSLFYGISAPVYGQSPLMDVVHVCQDSSLHKAAANFEGRRCFESERGWFFTADSIWAGRMSAAVGEAAVRFQKVFGDSLGRGAVLQIPGAERGPNDSLGKILPQAAWTWTSPVTMEEPEGFTGLERHEMGHGWFDLWANRHGTVGKLAHWMVETPAILMEDSVTTAIRYQNLATLPSQGARLIPLDELFTMKNPATQANASMADMMQAEIFYDECRTLLDFLAARTGDLRVFGSISLSMIRGSTMAEWLQANGAHYGLPATVPELDKAWRSWLP